MKNNYTSLQLSKLIAFILFGVLQVSSINLNAQNYGFEATAVSPPTNWVPVTGTWITNTDLNFVRTGVQSMGITSGAATGGTTMPCTTATVTVPASGTNYVIAIGWVKSSANSNGGIVVGYRTGSTNTIPTVSSSTPANSNNSTWSQIAFTPTAAATNGANYSPASRAWRNSTATANIQYLDDIIVYTSTSTVPDLTTPNIASGASIAGNALSWTNGTDNGSPASGIAGVLIIRANGASLPAPTLNNQAMYSVTNGAAGTSSFVNGGNSWSVITNISGNSTVNYTDGTAGAGPYTYVIYMRDMAFNYSSGTVVTAASNCSNPITPGISTSSASTVCILGSTNLDATGYTGGLNQTYQWQDSIHGSGVWNNLSGVLTGTFYTATNIASDRSFRCEMICSGGTPAYSERVPITVNPGLSGTYLVGAAQVAPNFATLTAAIAAFNACSNNNPVIFELTDATYSTSETFPLTINANPLASSTNTLTIRPASGVAATITGTSGTGTSALIRLSGADYVTFDGLNTGGASLTIENTTATTGNAVFWLISNGAGAGAKFNTIRNCNIKGAIAQNSSALVSYGIVIAGTTMSATTTSVTAGDDNDSTTISGNSFTKLRYGIYSRGGATTNPNSGLVITNNIIGPAAFGTDIIGKSGVLIREETNALIHNNEIRFIGWDFINTTAGSDRVGICFGTDAAWTVTSVYVTNTTVTKNNIHDIVDERTLSAIGIIVAGTDGINPTNNLVANNFISGLKANGTSSDQTIGIAIAAGNSDRIVYNSINLFGDTDPSAGSTTPTQSNHGIRISGTASTNVVIRNNIIVNDLTSSSAAGTVKNACIDIPASYAWGTGSLNYNDLYVNGGNSRSNTGSIGNTAGTFSLLLANWQTASQKDTNSIATQPNFNTPNDLHLPPGSNVGLNNYGSPFAGITDDKDGDTRDVANPDMGADEFVVSTSTDIGAFALVTPATTGCYSDVQTVVVRIKNYAGVAVDFGAEPATVTCNISGPTTTTLTGTPAGILPINGTQDVTLTGTFDMSLNGTYTFEAFTTCTTDINLANDTMTDETRTRSAIASGTVTAVQNTYCFSGAPVITLTGNSGGDIQWQTSTVSNNGPWTNVSGTNTYTPGTVTETTYYRVLTTCLTASDSTAADTVVVNSPAVLTSTPDTLCGIGQATLSATASAGATLNWYSASSGGTLLSSGSSYTTPLISDTTNYYVDATVVGPVISGGRLTNVAGQVLSAAPRGIIFSTLNAVEIDSIGFMCSGIASTVTVQLYNSGGTATIGSAITINIPANAGTNTVPRLMTFPVSIATPSAGTYRLFVTSVAPTGNVLWYEFSGVTGYPYAVGNDLSITSSVTSLTGAASLTTYYYFYKLSLKTNCSSARTLVTAVVTPSPPVTISGTTTICEGSPDTLSINNGLADYTTFTWFPATGLNQTTGASVIATPTVTTKYYVLASGNVDGCQAIDSITVTVNTFPLTITATPGQIVCGPTGNVQLNAVATGGTFTYAWTPSASLSDTTIANPVATPVAGATTYTVYVYNSVTGCTKSKTITLYHQDPQLLTTEGDTLCGAGNASLSATGNGGQVNWYNQSTGGTLLYVGSPYTTPYLVDTTTYYVSISEPVSQTPVTTSFGGGTTATDPNAAGNMFNIRAIHDIKVTGFDVHLNNNTSLAPSNISVYYRPGTYVGFTTNAGAWTLLGSVSGVTSAGNNVATTLPLALDLNIPAGSTYGIYIVVTNLGVANSLRYNSQATSVAEGAVAGSDLNLDVLNGTIVFGPFTALVGAPVNRTWNGSVKYSVGCETSRTAVVAVVNPGPTIDAISVSPAVCPGGSTDVLVTSSNDPDYEYTWTSNPAGFSALGSGPHTVSPSVTTTYIVTAVDHSGGDNEGCEAIDSVTVISGSISAGTISTLQGTICLSGTPTITASGSSGSRQWQQTNDTIIGTWINVGSGGTSFTPSTPITDTTFYRLVVSCDISSLTSNTVTVNVQSPEILSVTPDTVCGSGTVNLSATASAGATIKWYAAAIGGISLATGANFSTYVTDTTDFYAEPSESGGSTNSGLLITEIDLGSSDRLEITNVSGSTLNLTGYKVAVSNNYTTITTVNANIQSLSGTLAPGATLSWTDATAGPNYWGSNILWNPGAFPTFTGWAAILDNNNNLVDFVALNWPSANIQGASIVIGSTTITVGTQWTGDGINQTTVAATDGIARQGTIDNNAASDFAIIPLSVGTVNPGMTIPFTGLGCFGTRVAVTALVTPAPAILVSSADPAVCPGGSTTIGVTSTNDPDYKYTWTSNPAGFTASSGGPFTVSPTTTTTYYLSALDTTSGANAGCALNDSVSIFTGPTLDGGIISTPQTEYCLSGSPVITVTGSSGGAIQWQSSTVSASGPWTNVGTGATTYTPSLTDTSYFQAITSCPANADTSNVLTVIVNNPVVLTTTPNTRCGTGTTVLSATAEGSSTLNWYAASSGGSLLFTGPAFTTPIISSTTDFYVAAASGGGSNQISSNGVPTVFTATQNTGLLFDVNVDLTLNSIQVYANAVGTVTVTLLNSALTTLYTSTPFPVVVGGLTTPQTVPLGWNILAGTNYRILVSNTGGSIGYATGAFPAPLGNGVGTITNGATATGTSTLNYYVYNMNTSVGCESARVPVTATVTPAPSITYSFGSTICEADQVSLSVSSTNDPNYSYTWNPGNLSGASQTVTPSTTTTYTVNAIDNSTGCAAVGTVAITVTQRPVINTLTATPPAICIGDSSQLNVTATPFIAPTFAGAYSLTSLSGQTYATLTGGGITVINTAAQLLAGMGTGNQDDGGVIVTLPFMFTYNGTSTNQISFCTNGWIAASNQSTITASNMRIGGNLFTGTVPNNTIAAWFKDMGANFPTGTGSMRHGSIGTDVYAFQWDNAVGSGFSDGSTNTISFQINIYGPSSANPGRIELIYGPQVNTLATAAAIGIENATGGTNNYINALNGLSNSTTTSSAWPGDGNGYRFSPLPPSSLSYSWTNGASLNNAAIINPKAGPTASSYYAVTVLESGTGCSRTDSVLVTVSVNPTPSITPGAATICSGGDFLQYAVDLSGPYSGGYPVGTEIEWVIDGTPLPPPFLDPAVGVTTLGASTFQAIVHLPISMGSCTGTSSIVTVDHHTNEVTEFITDATCGNANGKVIVTVNGTAPFHYIWSTDLAGTNVIRDTQTSNTSDSITGLTGGLYYIRVIDNEGLVNPGISCTAGPFTYNVQSLNGPIPTVDERHDVTCNGLADGYAVISTTGGLAPISIQWSTGDTTLTVDSLSPGTYTVTVTDANGCSNTAETAIYEPAALEINTTSVNATCGMADGSATTVVTGGRPTYDYAWYDGVFAPVGTNSNVLSGVVAGIYYVVVTDSAGICTTQDTVEIIENCSVILNLTAFIEGYYSAGVMNSPLFNSGISLDANEVDSITVVLYDALDPTMEVTRVQCILHADGTAMAIFPPSVLGATCYIAILSRNSIETWSKDPVTFGSITNFDLAH